MTLRLKALLIVGVTLLCLLMTLYLSLSTLWLNGFAKIELQQTQQNVERVTEAIANDLTELNRTATDWAGWDATYAFVEKVNEGYIQDNLNDVTFANLRVNFMLFANTTGEITYGKGLDLQQKQAIPVPNSLRQYLATQPYFLQHKSADSSYMGIVVLPEGSLLVASQPILNSDRTASIRGTLLLCRFLNAAEIKRLSELTHLAIAIYPFQAESLPSDFQAVRNQLSYQASHTNTQMRSRSVPWRHQSLILVRPLNDKQVAGYTLLRDMERQPGLLLRVKTPREIYQQGEQGLHYLVGALLAQGLVFGCVIVLLLEKSVLSPLGRFSTAVRRMRSKGDLTERLSVEGRDELSRLGTALNQLLATLQQSQLQLYQSEERYRSVVHTVQEVIFQTDDTGIWTFLNPAWIEITGFSLEESIGQPCWKFIHPEDRPYYDWQFRQLIEGKTRDTRYEIRYRTREGCDRWLEVHSRLTVVGCSEIAGTAGTLNDITERKHAEAREREKSQQLEQTLRELTQTQTQLIQSEKMSSLGQLVAGVAHEINNPVSFIYGNVDYARGYIQDLLHIINSYQQHYPNPPEAIKAEMEAIDFNFLAKDLPRLLNSMKVGAERISEIVQSLRNFSRLNQAEFKLVNIHEGIDSTLLILQHQLKAKGDYAEIELIKEYGDLPLVECYPGQLNQVFMNLLANAIDALEDKREKKSRKLSYDMPYIRIYTEVKTRDASLGDNYSDASVLICISDNGTGISEEVSRRLFDPFFTTKPIGKGTGLGLSISYQIIVERHKGELYVKSKLGHGTEFVIELPIQQTAH